MKDKVIGLFSRFWRLVCYLGAMIALIVGLVSKNVSTTDACVTYLLLMTFIQLPRLADDTFEALKKEKDKDSK